VTIFQHALEDGLRDVFGRSPLTGELDEEAEERSVMALEQLAERIELSVSDGEHQIVIGEGGSDRFHGARSVFKHDRIAMDMNFWSIGEHRDRAAWLRVGCMNRLFRERLPEIFAFGPVERFPGERLLIGDHR
jgi:hypothetical protein